ncbi:HlyD family efflux transporter periplasmic adaptor subunit [Shewanella inventionis]|uniref:Membrane protein n=1 Tax=Shewanella inventionis TaxID=1738770 RepID=A0ABQ1INW1_9GAMM|nr:HlyD family efflux transporter periplasmic adaptor subunit [Shewanella inventionis]MCL1156532.1 HlyD family efflux transporter periplasmic adaptor subunit [Shewanella inventionis]UAL44226.1 HlyD family efflux transporter periplasmic adaptor subunit [Shewanella inventionis]GGB46249.1 membrane protein [Shewanella inventionis]
MKHLLFVGLIFSLALIKGCTPIEPDEALGTLERDRVLLRATAAEIITAQPIKKGMQISTGDLLVQFDTHKQAARLAVMQAEVVKAQAYLLKLTNGERPEDIASANSALKSANAAKIEAQKSYQRTASLLTKRLVSEAERDRALALRDKANAEYDAANDRLTILIKGVRQEDIFQAQAALDAANANLRYEQQVYSDLSIRATRNGVLDNLPYNVGERVPLSAVVAVIQADSAPYARVYIPEPYAAKLQIGQALPVKIDGFDKPFAGKLRWMSTEPAFTPYYALNQSDRSRLAFLAEINLDDSARDLPTGIPAQVILPAPK